MNKERQAKLDNALGQILQVLKKEYRPQKVILFGSMASGDVGEWSDIDLLIVKETNLPFLQRLKQVALLCQVPVSVDYLVYTPDELHQMLTNRNPFITEVMATGKLLYEREPAPALAG
jgi:predicted nucleotidyltransferase